MSRCFRCHLSLRYYLLCHVSPLCRACPYMYVHWAYKYARALVSLRQHLSSIWTPFQGGGGKNIQSFNFSSLSSALIMTPPLFLYCLFFFFLNLVLLIRFSLSSPPLIFLYLEIQSRVWETGRRSRVVPVPGGRSQGNTGLPPGLPPGLCELTLGVAGPFRLPGAPWPQPMGFLQSNSQTPSFSEKKTFLPVTTE